MNVLNLIIILAIIGLLLWLVNTYIPMAPNIKKILNIAVVVLVIIWLLRASGALGYISNLTL